MAGRPSKFNQELADRICEITATHDWGIRRICREFPDLPAVSTINLWRFKNDAFSALYNRAKLAQAELYAESSIDIADNDSRDTVIRSDGEEVCMSVRVARDKLRTETRRWHASKLLPQTYGNAVEIDNLKNQNQELLNELKELRDRLDKKNESEY